MKNKNLKKMIVPLVSVVALGIGAYAGLSADEVSTLETSLSALATAVITILGVFGVVANNDKEEK